MMEITSELTDLVAMQSDTQCLIYSIKNLAIGLQLEKLESNIKAMIRGKW